jgi:hypothetical protein
LSIKNEREMEIARQRFPRKKGRTGRYEIDFGEVFRENFPLGSLKIRRKIMLVLFKLKKSNKTRFSF